MAKIADFILIGCSGTKYTFSVYPLNTEFKNLGGVYYISRRTMSEGIGRHTNIYIGITNDLSTRFNDHHKEECFDKHQANCVSVFLCDSEKMRIEIEKDLLCNYDFLCNEVLNK